MKPINLLTAIGMLVVICLTACDDDENQIKPTVSSEIINDGINIPRNEVIKITFTDDMNASTINNTTFLLLKDASAVDGKVSYSERIATFEPFQELDPNETYTIKLTNGIRNIRGVSIEEKIIKFRTAGTKEIIAPILLGDALDFAVLAQTSIVNNPTSTINGDVGISPGIKSSILGFNLIDDEENTRYASSTQVNGRVLSPDMETATAVNLISAVNSMRTAYEEAEQRTAEFLHLANGNLGQRTLRQGIYKWTGPVTLENDIILSGSENDVWIFQVGQDFSVKAGVVMKLTNGALAKNVFWQVAGSVSLGVNSHVEGSILSKLNIVLTDGASLTGRVLSQGSITLNKNKIEKPERL